MGWDELTFFLAAHTATCSVLVAKAMLRTHQHSGCCWPLLCSPLPTLPRTLLLQRGEQLPLHHPFLILFPFLIQPASYRSIHLLAYFLPVLWSTLPGGWVGVCVGPQLLAGVKPPHYIKNIFNLLAWFLKERAFYALVLYLDLFY